MERGVAALANQTVCCGFERARTGGGCVRWNRREADVMIEEKERRKQERTRGARWCKTQTA